MNGGQFLGKLLLAFAAGSLAGCVSSSFSSAKSHPSASNSGWAQARPTIHWVKLRPGSAKMAVEIEGLAADTLQALRSSALDSERWGEIFSVYVDQNTVPSAGDLPAIQGRYEVLEKAVRFEPQFPLQPGVSYRAELRMWKLPNFGSPNHWATPKPPPIAASFRVPAPAKTPKTVVRQVYPSATQLPENLLKFYIHFSGPMSRGSIYDHIHLFHASGKAVELPFLEIDEELWNPELTRLTLFIDPGRIKRGVRPLEEIGPALEAGQSYALVIDQDWRDSDGVHLKSAYRKTFSVLSPDREPPQPSRWTVRAPKAGTRAGLVIHFPEPMDHALAERVIRVVGADRRVVPGRVQLADGEKEWRFTPEADWTAGLYQIVVSNLLEDLAGNSVGRPFEVDVFESVQAKAAEETVALPFEVRSR